MLYAWIIFGLSSEGKYMSNEKPVRLLGISGSLRKLSNCTAILHTLAENAAPGVDFKIFSLSDIPSYNGDIDVDPRPASVVALKTAIAEADGLVIISPEYNYGISGVLKNALDWASRPGYTSVMRDKPAAAMTSSYAFTGGARAQVQLRETLAAMLAVQIVAPEVVIANAADKIKDGRLTDQASLKAAQQLISALINHIRK
jgi:chromate reductase